VLRAQRPLLFDDRQSCPLEPASGQIRLTGRYKVGRGRIF
jgi:hypothetical protein